MPGPLSAAAANARSPPAQARSVARTMRGSRRVASLLLPFFFRRPAVHLPLPAPSLLRQVPRRPWEPSNILDPGGDAVLRWNRIFLVSCLVALFVDPLYFYLLYIGGPSCVRFDFNIAVTVTFLRTIADFFYLGHMILKFRIAFVAPSSRVFGRGELVRKPKLIAMQYPR